MGGGGFGALASGEFGRVRCVWLEDFGGRVWRRTLEEEEEFGGVKCGFAFIIIFLPKTYFHIQIYYQNISFKISKEP